MRMYCQIYTCVSQISKLHFYWNCFREKNFFKYVQLVACGASEVNNYPSVIDHRLRRNWYSGTTQIIEPLLYYSGIKIFQEFCISFSYTFWHVGRVKILLVCHIYISFYYLNTSLLITQTISHQVFILVILTCML